MQINWKSTAVFLVILVILASLFDLTDPLNFALALVVAFLLSGWVYKWIRKNLVRPIVVWDIHGVYITGDTQLEDLYEIKGTRDLIARVRKSHYVVAFTNFSPELFEFYSRKWGWKEMYDEIYYSGALKARKPNPEAFRKMLARLGVSKDAIVFIDDVADNVKAAHLLGIKAFQFRDSQQAEKELRQFGVSV